MRYVLIAIALGGVVLAIWFLTTSPERAVDSPAAFLQATEYLATQPFVMRTLESPDPLRVIALAEMARHTKANMRYGLLNDLVQYEAQECTTSSVTPIIDKMLQCEDSFSTASIAEARVISGRKRLIGED